VEEENRIMRGRGQKRGRRKRRRRRIEKRQIPVEGELTFV